MRHTQMHTLMSQTLLCKQSAKLTNSRDSSACTHSGSLLPHTGRPQPKVPSPQARLLASVPSTHVHSLPVCVAVPACVQPMYKHVSSCTSDIANANKPLDVDADLIVSRCPPDGQLVLAAVHVAAVADTQTHDGTPSEPSASE
jgi:hypothetical protein